MNTLNKHLSRLGFASFIITVFLTGNALALSLEGSPNNGPEGSGKKGHFDEIFDKIGLTQEQKTKISENLKQHHQENESVPKQVNDKRKELRAALEAPELNMNNVSKIHDELKVLMNKMEDANLASILSVRQVLTSEQFKKYQEMTTNKDFQPKNACFEEKPKE